MLLYPIFPPLSSWVYIGHHASMSLAFHLTTYWSSSLHIAPRVLTGHHFVCTVQFLFTCHLNVFSLHVESYWSLCGSLLLFIRHPTAYYLLELVLKYCSSMGILLFFIWQLIGLRVASYWSPWHPTDPHMAFFWSSDGSSSLVISPTSVTSSPHLT